MYKGAIRDQHLDYRLKSVWLRPVDFVTGATATTAGPATLTAGYTNGTNLPTALWPVGSFRSGVPGLRFATTAATINYVWRPYDLDNRHPVYLRYWWTSNSAGANVATWQTFYATQSSGLIMATPTTAVNRQATGVAKDAAALEPAMTQLAVISPLGTGGHAFHTFSPESQAIHFAIHCGTLSNGAIATEYAWLMGMEILYTPRLTFGDGSGRRARYMDPPLGTMEVSGTLDDK